MSIAAGCGGFADEKLGSISIIFAVGFVIAVVVVEVATIKRFINSVMKWTLIYMDSGICRVA